MSDIEIFRNEQFGEVRVALINDVGWLVGKDVAEVLGYKDTVNALKDHVDEDDKLIWQIATSGQKRNMIVINESGLYSLVLSSKLPSAKVFKRWVTTDVLPSIRKHGLYATTNTVENMLSDPDYAIQLLQKYKEERQEKEALQKKTLENEPKVLFADMGLFFVKETTITNPDGSVRVTKTTKVTGKGQIYFINKFQIGILS